MESRECVFTVAVPYMWSIMPPFRRRSRRSSYLSPYAATKRAANCWCTLPPLCTILKVTRFFYRLRSPGDDPIWSSCLACGSWPARAPNCHAWGRFQQSRRTLMILSMAWSVLLIVRTPYQVINLGKYRAPSLNDFIRPAEKYT
jgi:hypothetical protein